MSFLSKFRKINLLLLAKQWMLNSNSIIKVNKLNNQKEIRNRFINN